LRQQVSPKGQGGRRFRFVGDTIAELRKVVWPTRQEATYLTTIVIVVTVVVAMALWAIDLGFAELMNIVLLR
jgi:preprotein translocase subunit SecE